MDHFVRNIRLVQDCASQDILGKIDDPCEPLRDKHTKFGDHPAQTLDELGALATQKAPRTVDRHQGLLFNRLDRNKPHRRARDSFTYGLSINKASDLPRLTYGLTYIGGDQSNVVAKLCQLAGPRMRAATSFHTNQTRFDLGEETQ